MNPIVLRLRRYLAIAFAVFSLLLAARVVWAAWALEVTAGRIILALALCTLAFGLVKNHSTTLRLTAVICLLAALTLPMAVFNPLAVGDYLAAGEQPPSFPGALLWVAPLEIFLLASAYVLDLRTGVNRES